MLQATRAPRRKITTIAYGVDPRLLLPYRIEPDRYAGVITGPRTQSVARFQVGLKGPSVLGQYESMLLRDACLNGETI